jgi:hypothetical protein
LVIKSPVIQKAVGPLCKKTCTEELYHANK